MAVLNLFSFRIHQDSVLTPSCSLSPLLEAVLQMTVQEGGSLGREGATLEGVGEFLGSNKEGC